MGNKKVKENSGKQLKVVIVSNDDDWEGLYVDGKLYHQGHDIPNDVILEACNIEIKKIVCDQDWLLEESDGRLPEKLSDVKVVK